MTNSKSTKRALFSSALAVLLCVVMFIGTTFAWFTDTASTNVNKIQAGTLNVALEMKENGEWISAEGKTINFVAKDGNTNILWEPGCTYKLPELRIVNNGNLALKYKVVITGINGNAKLNEVIDWTIGDVAMGTEQHLKAGEDNEFTISGHMKENAGNEYMDLTISSISITVYATQDTVENDSNNNQYDKAATYYINNSDKQDGTLYNATKVTLDSYVVEHTYSGDETDGKVFRVYNGAELTLNDMDFSTTTENDTGKRNLGFYLYNGSKLTINSGNYTMDGQWSALIWAQGGKNGERCTVTINGGNFTVKGGGYSTIISVYSGYGYCGSDVYITGGFFDLSEANPNVTLQWKNDSTITVTGGTFVNYDPAYHKVVPAGYKVVSLPQSDGKTWYKVVPENAVSLVGEDAQTS